MQLWPVSAGEMLANFDKTIYHNRAIESEKVIIAKPMWHARCNRFIFKNVVKDEE